MPGKGKFRLKRMLVPITVVACMIAAVVYYRSFPARPDPEQEARIAKVEASILVKVRAAGPEKTVSAFNQEVERMIADDADGMRMGVYCGPDGKLALDANLCGIARAFGQLPPREKNLILKKVEDDLENAERQCDRLGRPNSGAPPPSVDSYLTYYEERYGPFPRGDLLAMCNRIDEAFAHAVDEIERFRLERLNLSVTSSHFRAIIKAEEAEAAQQ